MNETWLNDLIKQIKYIDFITYCTIFNIFDCFRYEDISDNTGIKVLKSPIQFEPPELDFKEPNG